MAKRSAIVASDAGLHARPAQVFVEAVQATGLAVRISTADRPPVDASSILMVMSLGAAKGSEVVLEADGDGSDEALDSLVDVIETNADEPAAQA